MSTFSLVLRYIAERSKQCSRLVHVPC